MSDWTSGYVTELAYTHGYYGELRPLAMRQALVSRKIQHRWGQPLRYLELGFGQGLSLNIHAAAMGGEWWGCDFNPGQAANAQELAAASGANLKVLDASFEELAARTDLPAFDIIALHGIWSWISDHNRKVIVEIAQRHLAVGGVFYVSYNTTPGWSASVPLRQLLTQHADLMSSEGQGMVSKIDAALDFAQSLSDHSAGYFKANPAVGERLTRIKGQDRNYLAHEYFNADWHPMPFSEMARHLSAAKLSFCASTHLPDQVDILNLSPDQQKFLNGISHPIFREQVRDYLVNQQFRRDLWVKGPRLMAMPLQADTIQAQSYVLMTWREDVPLKATGLANEVVLQAAIYAPLLDALADKAYIPKTAAQLYALLPDLKPTQIVEALLILSGMGQVSLVQSADAAKAAKPACDRLNTYLIKQAIHSGDTPHLASPVLGGGVAVNRFQQLFLKAFKAGRKTPAEWARETWSILAAQDQRLIKDGKTLDDPEQNIAELVIQANEFEAKRLPILRALQVA